MSAFISGPRVRVAATASGPLDGLRFAVKDLIDVAGVTTGGGNPDWRAGHVPALRHAPCVGALLAAGATLDGKTITDELAYSLEGANHHDGTPLNPRWPHALPGGSSSGSASAVASGEVDFALGTDTGGSVRVPAAFCGLWGMRPSHDAISLESVLPFAPCFDTVGWFARSIDVLAAVGDVLLPEAASAASSSGQPLRLVRVAEAFAARARNAPDDALRLEALAESLGADTSLDLFAGDEARWLACYQAVQDLEIDASLGDWIRSAQPRFGPSIAARFARLQTLDRNQAEKWRATRRELRCVLDATFEPDRVLLMPTTPVALLAKDASDTAIGGFYEAALTMNSIAAIGGLPQITLPFTDEIDRPLALSFIGGRGSDRTLLALARDLYSQHTLANLR
ncbi:Glutamyl-tRNA(Gln) amidotransferase subunit A, chloroplastic/mitochondrial [Paraburkholderia aspalathi]|uniref:Glutamyl-tRNA(Gln) amidotransferase subunit A, chloroplastic/mitochondrial n=1 Tax=Paraburkholderia aspalathi TaxID=1324617 RepID=A0ABN7M9F3_9BURK|nr:amidase [Paraburkholderia aspalathi]MBK3821013.1 amidase [Paraburkholderia aspalathi]MBK3832802.1 amidase [Paraburkholderia aspalathi]MBK3862608.1 amidase [Paraburkholderia aspalathi]CAE6792834.1 Glutamyl-tRNA(Gln) amidotransferase subunit A, chloroplastic/mitochondrial [Paraburkholderia aspalathi]